jgi:phosphatidylglycerol lysyltransferase
MEREFSIRGLSSLLKEHANPFLRENKKIILQFVFTLFFFAIGIWFIQHERSELFQVKDVLHSARWLWVLIGIFVTGIYILLQGLMYVFSFAATRHKVSLADSTLLFIKRNLISVFLPAGGVSSLAFFTGAIEKKGIRNTQIHFASSIYGFVGILSVILVAIPAFLYAVVEGTIGSGEWYALGAIVILKFVLFFCYRSILRKGVLYSILVKAVPSTEVFMTDLQNNQIDKKAFIYTVLTSVVIEFIGIAHLYIAMIALGFAPSLLAAILGYIISVIFLIVSPFLRGLGAIEVSMTYVLIRFGFGNVDAIAVTFLYRFFEFWLPLVVGILTFLSKLNKLLMRVFPAFFLLVLGIINIVSVLTPAISERVNLLKDFLPVEAIHASNYLVLMAGLLLLVTAAFLLKGLRAAWWFAVFLSLVSLVGHLTKAIDFEEASIAFLAIVMLVGTRKEYYIKTNPKMRNVGLQTSVLTAFATLIYGIVGFYFLDKKHFNIDFNIWQSIGYTVQSYFLMSCDSLVPASKFASKFLLSINISGFVSIAFLIYTFVRTYVPHENITDEERELANCLIKAHGNSALDHFKTSADKIIYVSESKKAFVAYRISGNFAVVLENPVAKNAAEMKACIAEFDRHCYESGMKSIYYRVPEESLDVYRRLRHKYLFLGQEGVVDLTTFKLEGGAKKPMRNAINKVIDRGFKATIHEAPVKDGILQKIKSVSDEWLTDMERTEIIFSQGMFCWEELKQQTIITVENSEEKIVAFLNIIPDYAPGEATYDLIRKTKDAPNGVMDFILVELFKYLKEKQVNYVNLGFAPMSGLDDPHTFPEKSMKFAYEKIRSFAHYKGLREYKEKFDPVWHNKYLIYQHDYDLLQVPAALAKVIKP